MTATGLVPLEVATCTQNSTGNHTAVEQMHPLEECDFIFCIHGGFLIFAPTIWYYITNGIFSLYHEYRSDVPFRVMSTQIRAVLIILSLVVIGVSSRKYDTKMAVWFFFVYHQRFFWSDHRCIMSVSLIQFLDPWPMLYQWYSRWSLWSRPLPAVITSVATDKITVDMPAPTI